MRAENLLNKSFLLLLQGQFVSQMGSAIYTLALISWLKQETNSVRVVGLLVMAGTLPAVLLGPFGGTIADYYSRKKIIVGGDLINGSILVAVALIMLNTHEESGLIVGLLFASAVIGGVISALYRPAMSAAIPDIVPATKIDAANGFIQFLLRISVLLGQSLAGVLFRAVGLPVLMLASGLSYLFSSSSESFMDFPKRERHKRRTCREAMGEFRVNMIDGLQFVWRETGLRVLFLTASVVSFVTAPISLLFAFYVEENLNATPEWYGFIMAGMSAGAISGSMLAGTVKISSSYRSKIVIANLVMFSVSLCILSICTDAMLVSFIMFFVGVCSGFQGVLITSTLQRAVPADMRGRVFGLLGTILTGLAPVSVGLVGMGAGVLGENLSLLFLVSGFSSLLVAPFLILSKEFHRLLATEA